MCLCQALASELSSQKRGKELITATGFLRLVPKHPSLGAGAAVGDPEGVCDEGRLWAKVPFAPGMSVQIFSQCVSCCCSSLWPGPSAVVQNPEWQAAHIGCALATSS